MKVPLQGLCRQLMVLCASLTDAKQSGACVAQPAPKECPQRGVSGAKAGAASAGEGAKQLRQPLLQAAARLASGECRRVLRRVRVVENRAERRREAVYARMLAKAAAANPLAVLDTVVDHARPSARTH